MKTVIDFPAPRVLRSEDDYQAALAEIDRLLDLDPQAPGPEYDRLELLSVLVEDYEERHHPIDDSNLTPQDVLEKGPTLNFPESVRELLRGDIGQPEGG